MAIIRNFLSAAGSGANVSLATSLTTVHVVPTTTGLKDEVHVWVGNNGASTTTLTMCFGTTNGAQPLMEIPASQGLFLISPGLTFATGHGVFLQAGAANTLFAYGFVNRLTTGV